MKQQYTLVASYVTEDNGKGIIKEEIDSEHGIAGMVEGFMNKITSMDKVQSVSELAITISQPNMEIVINKDNVKQVKGFMGFNFGGK